MATVLNPPLRPALSRRHCLAWLAGSLATTAATASHAAAPGAFPTRPISLWVPWQAGGGTDAVMRLLAEAAGEILGQKVLIENRGGAGGTLAMPVLQQAAPDGYTIAQLPQTVFRAPHVQKLAWDPIRDTTPILQLTGTTFGIVVAAESPIKQVDDLFAAARKDPGKLSIATNGVGTTPHVVMSDLMGARGLSFIHVPYKGVSEQTLAVASGEVAVGVGSTAFGAFVDSGKLRLLATFGEHRTKRWPQVPTLKELGLGVVAMSPYGLAGPAGMPEPIVGILHDAFKAALFNPRIVAELAKYDQEPSYLGPAAYAASCRETFKREAELVKRLGLDKS